MPSLDDLRSDRQTNATQRVDIVHWNPRRRRFRGPLRRIPVTKPLNNFGDILGPKVVEWVRAHRGLDDDASRAARLLSVGSIMSSARTGDVIWGTGVNGKVRAEDHTFTALDVRALRGPLSHEFLRARGIATHEVPYGDPALLLGRMRPDLVGRSPRFASTVIYNLYDNQPVGRSDVVDPRAALERILERISQSRLVVGTSLHAIVVAEALGIPARAVRSRAEPEFKYADYYLGSGRTSYEIADSIDDAIDRGGMQPPEWSAQQLLDAFPDDLWVPARVDSRRSRSAAGRPQSRTALAKPRELLNRLS